MIRRRKIETATATRRNRRGPRVESLEARELMASLVVLNDPNRLLTIDSAAPSIVTNSVAVTGLQAGEKLLGIDVRPANGLLYGLGSSGRLYTINTFDGTAAQVGTGTFAVPLRGFAFGFDFNPVPDRIRVTSDAGQNIRLNPDTGAIVDADPNTDGLQVDGDLNFDPATGLTGTPSVTGVAYTNPDNDPATGTTLFAIAPSLNRLFIQNPPNNGTLVNPAGGTTAAPTGLQANAPLGFDIAPSGVAFVASSTARPPFGPLQGFFPPNPRLFTIDLATGATTPLGSLSVFPLDIAVMPTIQFTSTVAVVAEGSATATITVTRSDFLAGTSTVAIGTVDGTATAGLDYTQTISILSFAPGETTKTFSVPILNDSTVEAPESIRVFLAAAGGASIGLFSQADILIVDDDTPFIGGPQAVDATLIAGLNGITGARVSFSQPINFFRAINPVNYLVEVSNGGRFRSIPIARVDYLPGTQTANVIFGQGLSQSRFRSIRITLRSGANGLTSILGAPLDGNGDARPGDDASFTFNVFRPPFLRFATS